MAVRFLEVAAQRFCLRIRLLQGPAALGVGALRYGIVAGRELFEIGTEVFGEMKGSAMLRIAVKIHHQGAIPITRDVDAVFRPRQQTHLGGGATRL